jgi:hypothetical protein
MSGFEAFLKWEEKSRDTIDFKKAYVDMTGDVVAGLMLSQIIYWHLPDRGGQGKLRVERDSLRWLVKTRDEWWHECRLNPREVDRARKVLETRGIIEVRLYKFNGSPTQHLRIQEDRFLELWQEVIEGEMQRSKTKFNRSGGGEPRSDSGPLEPLPDAAADPQARNARPNPLKPPISLISKMDFTNPLNGFPRLVKSNSLIRENHNTEITTETTTETAAAKGVVSLASPDADAALVEQLIGHGVGRSVARKLVRDKPEVCRRCLEYLPYARFRTTKGAWLANAIRDEYGPPPGYEETRARQDRVRKRALLQDARQSQQDARRRKKEARLRAAYARLEKNRGAPYTAFTEYLDQERARVAKIAGQLSPRRQEEQLAAFDQSERRLQVFAEWLETQGQGIDTPRPTRDPNTRSEKVGEQGQEPVSAVPTTVAPKAANDLSDPD